MSDFDRKRAEYSQQWGIAPQRIPRHVAIIMDGNGRWATRRGLPRFEGHSEGGRTVERIVQYCVDIGVECLSLFSFSMENWKRPKEEVEFLMYLYTEYLLHIRPMLMKSNVRLVHLGREDGLPEPLVEALHETMHVTESNDGLALGLAMNYSSRCEIADSARRLAVKCLAGEISPDDITEQSVADNLYTAGLPDPDLVIRTSNELRISNFLLWQISYSEFYVTEKMWPEMQPQDIRDAISAFASRQRRFGDVSAAK